METTRRLNAVITALSTGLGTAGAQSGRAVEIKQVKTLTDVSFAEGIKRAQGQTEMQQTDKIKQV